MAFLEQFTLRLTTGGEGPGERPRYAINGFSLDFDELKGGTGPGETLEASGSPESYPHSLVLHGPKTGQWEISGIELTYYCMDDEPYTVRLGPVTLDNESDLNLWHERPAYVFAV